MEPEDRGRERERTRQRIAIGGEGKGSDRVERGERGGATRDPGASQIFKSGERAVARSRIVSLAGLVRRRTFELHGRLVESSLAVAHNASDDGDVILRRRVHRAAALETRVATLHLGGEIRQALLEHVHLVGDAIAHVTHVAGERAGARGVDDLDRHSLLRGADGRGEVRVEFGLDRAGGGALGEGGGAGCGRGGGEGFGRVRAGELDAETADGVGVRGARGGGLRAGGVAAAAGGDGGEGRVDHVGVDVAALERLEEVGLVVVERLGGLHRARLALARDVSFEVGAEGFHGGGGGVGGDLHRVGGAERVPRERQLVRGFAELAADGEALLRLLRRVGEVVAVRLERLRDLDDVRHGVRVGVRSGVCVRRRDRVRASDRGARASSRPRCKTGRNTRLVEFESRTRDPRRPREGEPRPLIGGEGGKSAKTYCYEVAQLALSCRSPIGEANESKVPRTQLVNWTRVR